VLSAVDARGAVYARGVEHKDPPPVLDVRREDALAVGLQEDNPGLGVRHRDAAPGLCDLEGVRRGVDASVVDTVDQKDLTGEISSSNEPEIVLCPYEVFVISPHFQDEIGIGLIDTGAQVSLVRKKSPKENVPRAKFRTINVNIQGINEDDIHIKEGIMLQINDSKETLFYIVDSIPRGLDISLSQEWLLQNDYMMTCSNAILPFSKSVVKIPTEERGLRFVNQTRVVPRRLLWC
jgi:hypothetical protein